MRAVHAARAVFAGRWREVLGGGNWVVWLIALGGAVILGGAYWHLLDEALVDLVVRVSPGRQACVRWVEQLRAAGFRVQVESEPDLLATHGLLHVPDSLQADHTGITVRGRYVIEGHVPADSIQRLLIEQPPIRGLAVPGAPAGAPGVGGEGVFYVMQFSRTGQISLYERRNSAELAGELAADPDERRLMLVLPGVAIGLLGLALVAGLFNRMTIHERHLEAQLLILPALENLSGDRADGPRGLEARLFALGVEFQRLRILSVPVRPARPQSTGWIAPARFRQLIIDSDAAVAIRVLPAGRFLVIEFPRANLLGQWIGAIRAPQVLARHRQRRGYRDTALYLQRFRHCSVFLQPIREERAVARPAT